MGQSGERQQCDGFDQRNGPMADWRAEIECAHETEGRCSGKYGALKQVDSEADVSEPSCREGGEKTEEIRAAADEEESGAEE